MRRQSTAGLLLPGIVRGQPLLETLLQTAESPSLQIRTSMEAFADRLRPDTTPTAWLPWVFWALGGEDYYRPDWDETRTRLVLSRLVDLYRARGTVEGLRLHLRLLADATLVRTAQPPARTFLLPSLTQAERAELETHYPEVRLRTSSQMGTKQSLFTGDCLGDPAEHADVFLSVTDADARLAEQARLYDPDTGVERPLQRATVDVAGLVVRLGVRGHAAGMMVGHPLHGAVLDEGAASRLYTFALQAGTDDPIRARAALGAQPGMIPVDIWPTLHAEPGSGRGCFLWNRWADAYPDRGGAHLPTIPMRRRAEVRIWKSFRLFDPARAVTTSGRASVHLGAVRIGQVPPHVMEAQVSSLGRRPHRVAWPGTAMTTPSYLAASDAPARIARIRWAGNLARRAGCRVPVAIRTRRPLLVDPSVLCGLAITNDTQEVI